MEGEQPAGGRPNRPLKILLATAGISARELADQTGVSLNVIQNCMSGRSRLLADHACRIASTYALSPSALMEPDGALLTERGDPVAPWWFDDLGDDSMAEAIENWTVMVELALARVPQNADARARLARLMRCYAMLEGW